MGAAWDWSIVTGLDDARTVQILRELQLKLSRAGALMTIGTVSELHDLFDPSR